MSTVIMFKKSTTKNFLLVRCLMTAFGLKVKVADLEKKVKKEDLVKFQLSLNYN